MSKPTLTALYLVKNEEEFLSLSVATVVDGVDRIIIIDNGSTDGTLDAIAGIKAAHPMKVETHVFKDDFDKACEYNNRNKSLELVRTDWVMMLDADQLMSDGWHKWVVRAMADKKYDAIRFRYQHLVGSMEYIHKTFYEKHFDSRLHPDVPLWQTMMYRMRPSLKCSPASAVNSFFREQHHANCDQSMKDRKFYNCGSATCWHFGFAKRNMMDMSCYRIHRGDYGHEPETKERLTKELRESENPFKFIGSVCRGYHRKEDMPWPVRKQWDKQYKLELDADGFIQKRVCLDTGIAM